MFHTEKDEGNDESLDSLEDDKRLDNVGAHYLKLGYNDEVIFEDVESCFNVDLDAESMFVVNVPLSKQGTPEIVEAKKKELDNLKIYETFEEVDEKDVTNENIIGSRGVVTEKQKQDGQKQQVKARLVARGFQEKEKPQSDAPAAHRESFKLFMAVAAMKGFKVSSLDIRAAFLQAKDLDRTVYIEPPKDVKKDGVV